MINIVKKFLCLKDSPNEEHDALSRQPPGSLKAAQEDLVRLFSHAAKNPNINLTDEFLQRAVPLLYRNTDLLSPKERIDLWSAYNRLAVQLSPATVSSLKAAEVLSGEYTDNDGIKLYKIKWELRWLKWFLILIVALVVLAQGYSLLIKNGLKEMESLDAEYEKVLTEERLAYAASIDAKPSPELLKSIDTRKQSLATRAYILAKNQCNFQIRSFLGFQEFPGTDGMCRRIGDLKLNESPLVKSGTQFLAKTQSLEPSKVALSNVSTPGSPQAEPTADVEKNGTALPDTPEDIEGIRIALGSIGESGKAIDLVLNSLVLPFLLGFLGAIAYLTRRTLTEITDRSYTVSWTGRYALRVLLGGLLGVIGPFLYTSGKVEDIGLGLSLFAFLLGYSVELAFSLFDRFIDSARDTIKLEPKPRSAAEITDIGPAETGDGSGGGAAAGTGVSSGGQAEQVAQARLKLAEIRRQLQEIEAVAAILETVLLPEYYESEVAPKRQAARVLLDKLESGFDEPGIDPDALINAVAEAEYQGKALGAENHPLVPVLGAAATSFAEVIGPSASSIALSLFTGTVAAFREGAGVYQRWLAYVLSQPHIPRLAADNRISAAECLAETAIFQRAFGAASATLTTRLLQLALSEKTPEQLAEDIWADPAMLEDFAGNLGERFSGIDEFAEGWIEYRRVLLRFILQHQDFPEDAFPGETSGLRVSDTLEAIEKLRAERTSAKDLDILGNLAAALLKASTANANLDVVGLIKRLLPMAAQAEPQTQAASMP